MNNEENNPTKCPLCKRSTHKESKYCIFHASKKEKTRKEFKEALKNYIIEIKGKNEKYDFKRFIFIGDIDFRVGMNIASFKRANFEYAKFHGYANFEDVKFQGYVSFRSVKFYGDAVFQKAKFNRSTYFRNARFHKKAIFKYSKFNGIADFREVKFQNTEFWHTKFQEYAHFMQTKFQNTAIFVGTTFQGIANFMIAKFQEKAYFEDAKFQEKAYFEDAKFQEKAYFINTIFQGEANFENTEFQEKVDFFGTIFQGEANFENSKFKKEIHFIGNEFNSYANFEKVNINDYADFSNTSFKGSLDFSDALLAGKIFLLRVTFEEYVDFKVKTIKDFISFNYSTFKENVDFQYNTFEKSVYFNGVTFLKNVNFNNSKFYKNVSLANAIFPPGRELYLRVIKDGIIKLNRSYLENVYLDFELDNGVLIDFTDAILRNTKIIKKQIENHILHEKEKWFSQAKEIYLLLKNNFHSIGKYDDESWAYIKERDMEKSSYLFTNSEESHRYQDVSKKKNIFARFILIMKSFMKWLFSIKSLNWFRLTMSSFIYGYGENPWCVIRFASIVIFLFAIILNIFGIVNSDRTNLIIEYIKESKGNGYALKYLGPTLGSFLNCLYFSVVTFTTLGYGDFQPAVGASRFFVSLEAIIGAITMALFVYTFARRTGGR